MSSARGVVVDEVNWVTPWWADGRRPCRLRCGGGQSAPRSRIASSGARYRKLRLRDFPPAQPLSAELGLARVQLATEEILAPPPSGLSFSFDLSPTEVVHLRVEPVFLPGPTNAPSTRVRFAIQVNGETVAGQDLSPALRQAPWLVPVRSRDARFTVALVTLVAGPASGGRRLEAGWRSPKLILGRLDLDTARIRDLDLRAEWARNNPVAGDEPLPAPPSRAGDDQP